MTQEEKAKRYDEVINKAKSKIKNDKDHVLYEDDIIEIFPELKESEDEKIRKAIYNCVKWFGFDSCFFKDVSQEECLAWLEKQAQKTFGFNNSDTIEHNLNDYCCKIYSALHKENGGVLSFARLQHIAMDIYGWCKEQGEQKPADKVKPKFKVGDWIINNEHNNVAKVLEINNEQYRLDYCDTVGTISIALIDNDYHLWTIQDAKDGNVLVASDGSIFLFKETADNACKHYVALTTDGVVNFNKGWEHYWETSRVVYPATKEQCALLFQKMKENGYEWDAEKKGLKKIEHKPLSEEDKAHIDSLLKRLEGMCKPDATFISTEFAISEDEDWLKSLRHRLQWKPSDEQMEALDDFIYAKCPNIEKHGAEVKSLYQDLKKLREE